jgi:WD40 repeat protein
MRLTYKPAFSIALSLRTVVSVKFSICGTMLIATTTDLRACVWDVSTGQQFYPEVEFDSPALSLLWITDTAVLVGLANGTLMTFIVSIASRKVRFVIFSAINSWLLRTWQAPHFAATRYRHAHFSPLLSSPTFRTSGGCWRR